MAMDVGTLRAVIEGDARDAFAKIDAVEQRLDTLAKRRFDPVTVRVATEGPVRDVARLGNAMKAITDKSVTVNVQTSGAVQQVQALGNAMAATQARGRAMGAMSFFGREQQLQRRGYYEMASGAALTGAFTAPLVAGGAAAVKFGMDFEESMQHVVALTEVSKAELAGLKKQVLELSADPLVRQGPTQLAEALYYVASTGLKGADAMTVLRASAYGASAGLGETKVVANTVTSVLDAYGLSADKAMRVTDTLTQAVKFGKGEADKYAAAFAKVIPIASQAGVSFEEVAAQMASATRIGLTPSETATALRQIFNNIIDPSEKSKKAMRELGTPAGELLIALREKGLFNVLKDLNTRSGGRIGPITELFGNIRALTGFLATTGTATLEEYRRTLEGIEKGGGATTVAAGLAMETLAAKWDKFKSSVQAAGIAISDKALPELTRLADMAGKQLPAALQAASDRWASLSETQKKAVLGLVALVALAGPVKILAGSFLQLGSALLGVLGVFQSIHKLAAGSALMTALFGTAAGGVGVALALGAVALAYKKAKDEMDALRASKKAAEVDARNAALGASAINKAFEGVESWAPKGSKMAAALKELQQRARAAGNDSQKLASIFGDLNQLKISIKDLDIDPTAEAALTAKMNRLLSGLQLNSIKVNIEMPDESDRAKALAAMKAARAYTTNTNDREAVMAAMKAASGAAALAPAGPPRQPSAALNDRLKSAREARDAAAQKAREDALSGAELLKLLKARQRANNALYDSFGKKYPNGAAMSDDDLAKADKVLKTKVELEGKIKALEGRKRESDKERAAQAADAKRKQAEENANRTLQQQGRTGAQLAGVWDKFGGLIDRAAGSMDTLGMKTHRAQMHAALLRDEFAAIPAALKAKAEALAALQDRFGRAAGVAGDLRDVFTPGLHSLMEGGAGPAKMSEMFGALEGLRVQMDIQGKLRRLTEMGLPLAAELRDKASTTAGRLRADAEAKRVAATAKGQEIYGASLAPLNPRLFTSQKNAGYAQKNWSIAELDDLSGMARLFGMRRLPGYVSPVSNVGMEPGETRAAQLALQDYLTSDEKWKKLEDEFGQDSEKLKQHILGMVRVAKRLDELNGPLAAYNAAVADMKAGEAEYRRRDALRGREHDPMAALRFEMGDKSGRFHFLRPGQKIGLEAREYSRLQDDTAQQTADFVRNERRVVDVLGAVGKALDGAAHSQHAYNRARELETLRADLRDDPNIRALANNGGRAAAEAEIEKRVRMRRFVLEQQDIEAGRVAQAEENVSLTRQLSLLKLRNDLLADAANSEGDIAQKMRAEEYLQERIAHYKTVDPKRAEILAGRDYLTFNEREAAETRGGVLARDRDAPAEEKRRLAMLGAAAGHMGRLASNDPELEIQLRLAEERLRLEDANAKLAAAARVDVEKTLASTEKILRAEAANNQLRERRAAITSAEHAALDQRMQTEMMLAHTARERLAIEWKYQDAKRKDGGATPEEMAARGDQADAAAQGEAQQRTVDAATRARDLLVQGFEQGAASAAKTLMDTIKHHLFESLATRITNKWFGGVLPDPQNPYGAGPTIFTPGIAGQPAMSTAKRGAAQAAIGEAVKQAAQRVSVLQVDTMNVANARLNTPAATQGAGGAGSTSSLEQTAWQIFGGLQSAVA